MHPAEQVPLQIRKIVDIRTVIMGPCKEGRLACDNAEKESP